MLVAEKFMRFLVSEYGKHTVYTDVGTWYDEECNVIGLKHYLYTSVEKSLMERMNHYLKDRIKSFDDYNTCRQKECNLFHMSNLLQCLVSIYISIV